METPCDSIVISSLCSFCEEKAHADKEFTSITQTLYPDNKVTVANNGFACPPSSYLEIGKKLSQCHLLAISLDTLHLKTVPQCPLSVIILGGREKCRNSLVKHEEGFPESCLYHLNTHLSDLSTCRKITYFIGTQKWRSGPP